MDFPSTPEAVQEYAAEYGWHLGIKNAAKLVATGRFQDLDEFARVCFRDHLIPLWKPQLNMLIREYFRGEPPLPRPEPNPNRVNYSCFESIVIYEVGYNGPMIRGGQDANASMRAYEERRAVLDNNEVFV